MFNICKSPQKEKAAKNCKTKGLIIILDSENTSDK